LTIADQVAILSGKFAASAIRLLGAGLGSNFPGRIARKVAPNVLGDLCRKARQGIIAVTGTNGKSTTSGLLSSILKAAGLELVHNTQGANLVPGITACLINAASWDGRLDIDYCLFEIDEAALPLVAREVKIGTIVVTNLFRDQLDRFGELDTTSRLIDQGIAINTSLSVLNADDPNVSQLAPNSIRLFFGIESLIEKKIEKKTGSAEIQDTNKSANAELAYCHKCGEEVTYSKFYYGQLGLWKCSRCPHGRPKPDVWAENVDLYPEYSEFQAHVEGSVFDVHVPLPGLFNVYNALAALATATTLSISHQAIRDGLKTYKTLFGRSEKVTIQGKQVLIQLIKNPAGASQAVSSVVSDPKALVLIAINDNLADGRDISWLWDADFEQLSTANRQIIVSGSRAEDMAVRMKYAGCASENIVCVPKLNKALDEALSRLSDGQTLRLLPTYTCLLELQKLLKTRGVSLSGT
jgi:UDP-N-acetylmuramyl tripeptide synthase